MVNRITRSILMFFLAWKDAKLQKSYNFPGNTNFERLLLDLLETIWFITFSTKQLICKTSLRFNWCFIKLKTKTLQVCFSQFCSHNQLLFIALYLKNFKDSFFVKIFNSLIRCSFWKPCWGFLRQSFWRNWLWTD